jgi:GDP-L-fucose synthase
MGFWENKRVTVTGGKGFLGFFILDRLKQLGCQNIATADLPEYNLTKLLDIQRMYKDQKPDIVIHLAAVVGGIGANRENPGRYFYENAIMGIQLMHEAYLNKIEKFVAIGTICAYPKFTPVPFKEEDLWNGYPEETNAPYGLAKKMMLVQSQAYREQYDFNSIFLLPVNLYGPRDNFDPKSSHVIPALIKKCVDSINQGKNEIVVWGTGKPSREFIYVEDASEGILLATEKYNKS